MKAARKAKHTPAAKRDLFAELSEGMTALAQARQGKRTLRTHAVNAARAHGAAGHVPFGVRNPR